MTSMTFSVRLNNLLDLCDFPQNQEDREITFCEYFNMPQQKAKMILDGSFMPRKSIIEKIAEELFLEKEALIPDA